jgi:proline iminopeptidase
VYERYRLHFKPALKRTEDYERLIAAMKAGFTRQGNGGIVKARAIEDRLMRDTWEADAYDLLPRLRGLQVPTLVIGGAYDFIPPEIAARIAGALPRARLVALPDCGHFTYLECPAEVHAAVSAIMKR